MNFKKIQLLLCCLILAFTTPLFAQTNYADVKVDDLTDAQIRQLMQRAEAIGYTDAQIEQLAAAQGMKSSELQKLKLRVEKIRKQEGTAGKTQENTKERELDRSRNQQEKLRDTLQDNSKINANDKESKFLEEQKTIDLFAGLKPKIFGSELFRNGEITFEPNLRMATPRDYIIGPDDELLVDLTGDNEKDYRLKVSPDGNIRMEYVGLIAVSGLSIEQASSKIRRSMQGTYPALRTGRTNVAITIGNIRSIRVVLTGAIVKPGTYTLPSLATVFNALYASGGPNENGSFRKVQVIRNNRLIRTIDTYSFLLNGIQTGNIRLQDQDVINVPVYEKRVEVSGEIKRFALFEVVEGENLSDVLNFAGGFSSEAYTAKVKVLQNTNKERRVTDVEASAFEQYIPKNGDKFIIEPILDRFENKVEITGAVFRPGMYELEKGLMLSGLIKKAEGLTEDAYLYRGNINRLNPDNTPALISFDVAKIMNGSATDIALLREDKVLISSIFDMRDEYKVDIQGEVRLPGSFPFARPMRLEDLIQLAGGFKEGATPNSIEIARRVKNSDANSKSARTAEIFNVNVKPNLQLSDKEFILEPFDIVSVRSAEGYTIQKQVLLEGEVMSPGLYTINKKDERISDIINRAGGLTSSAYAEGASLRRPGPDGEAGTDPNVLEREKRNLLNLKRVQGDRVKDTTDIEEDRELLQSDLVGINLKGILEKPRSNYDLLLEDGDVIRVPKMLQTVRVSGEVLNPNSIIYRPGKNLKQYVNNAGGFTTKALKKNLYIIYANGSAEAAKRFLFFNNYPRVKPGAEIFVPKRGEREAMTTQGWIAISTGLASMAAIIITLFR
ncbi:MAG: capsule biosynthesis protein [Pedobacter sp.]|nr:MAG: capsule biosynthesis protein [Pedobacter sp.]